MLHERSGAIAGVLNGCLFVAGGSAGNTCLNSVEKLDLTTQTWSEVNFMSLARTDACSAVLDGWWYVVGGRDEKGCLDSVEKFDGEFWSSEFCTMNSKRYGAAAMVLDGTLYVAGGSSET